MHVPVWQPLPLTTDTVDAKPAALWTRVHDYVAGPVKLKISAAGEWTTAPQTPCGPAGAHVAGFPSANGLDERALRGALIGKVGGSASEKPATDAFTFVAGEFAIVVLGDKVEGALYLTMNDEVAAFKEHGGSVTVAIEVARSA